MLGNEEAGNNKLSRPSTTVSLRLHDLVTCFDGSTDFSEWIRKFEMVAKLQKMEELHLLLPMLLAGGAFAVYENSSEEMRGDYAQIKRQLMTAFSLSPFQAYAHSVNRKLKIGESVDVYVADLRRLASIFMDQVDEQWLKCAVVHGLPSEIKGQLVGEVACGNLKLEEVLGRIRALWNNGVQSDSGEVAMVAHGPAKITGSRSVSGGGGARSSGPVRSQVSTRVGCCFQCGKYGHLARSCSQKNGTDGNGKQPFACFNCGEQGHFARSCPKNG